MFKIDLHSHQNSRSGNSTGAIRVQIYSRDVTHCVIMETHIEGLLSVRAPERFWRSNAQLVNSIPIVDLDASCMRSHTNVSRMK